MSSQTVISQFESVAASNPNKGAIFWGREKITYGQLRDRIQLYAANLRAKLSKNWEGPPSRELKLGGTAATRSAVVQIQQLGTAGPPSLTNVTRQPRVGLLLKNSPEFIFVLYAALKNGATVVPINNFLKPPEIQHIIDDCKLDCLVTSADFDEIVAKLERVSVIPLAELDRAPRCSGASVKRRSFGVEESPALNPSAATTAPAVDTTAATPTPEPLPVEPLNREPSSSPIAVIIYTSGTTGKPKGALLTHDNIASNVQSCVQALEETSNDRLTLLLPMFHSFMLTVCIFTPLSVGAGIVLIKSVHPFKAAMREMIMNRATIFVGIPQIFQALAQAKIPFWLHWVLKLRMAVSGAAPLPRETLEAFQRKMRFPLLEGYGLSEASPVVSFNPYHGVRKPGSVGLPLPDIEVKIFDDHDKELPAEQVGEIVVRGPNVMQGYYNQPEETAVTLRNGWLHTGDMGKKDADGYIYIVDRRKEMFLVRGMNVYPREIEEVLYQFPNVREAAVVARPDEKRGEAAIAFVSPVEGATLQPDEILKFCRERLADYKLPKEIKIAESLPHTATGKIAKLELKKQL